MSKLIRIHLQNTFFTYVETITTDSPLIISIIIIIIIITALFSDIDGVHLELERETITTDSPLIISIIIITALFSDSDGERLELERETITTDSPLIAIININIIINIIRGRKYRQIRRKKYDFLQNEDKSLCNNDQMLTRLPEVPQRI